MQVSKRLYQASAYYASIYMATTALVSYLSLFYADMNISESKIGILASVTALVGIGSTSFWGTVSDRAKVKNKVLVLCLLTTAVFVWALPLAGEHLWLLLLVMCLFFFFQSAINPLSDAITLELASQYQFRFATVRTSGAVGFATMSFVAGSLISYHINMIFVLYCLLILLAWLIFIRLPAVEGYQRSKRIIHFWEVLRHTSLKNMYLYVLFISVGLGFYISFHALYSIERNITTSWLGLTIMISSLSQLPITLYFDKLYTRYGVRKLLLVAGLCNAVRWLGYAIWLNAYTLIIISLLHGGSFILIYLCLAEYAHRHIRGELKVSGQMMNFIVLNGVGRVVGAMFGGIAAEMLGFAAVFAMAGMIALLGVIFFWHTTRFNQAEIGGE